MDAKKQIPGARESSAGDDFHLLWAGRKALRLLMPKSDLIALSIEGPHPEEADYIDPEGDQLLAIDLTEYFGGDRFVLAEKVFLSQLKYSTRTPEKEWTAARLSEGKFRGKKANKTNNWTGSIIHRLAQAFEGYYNNYERGTVLEKLVLKLVSNRPTSELLSRSIEAAKEHISKQNPGTTSALLKILASDQRAEIERLYNSSNLGSKMFLDFLRVLDFSECGQQSRFGQNINLVKELGRFGPGNVTAQYARLKELIWDCMMPQAANKSPLTKYDILPIFNCGYRDLFPAESFLELPKQMLERNECVELAHVIQASTKKLVCLHSGGGKGKTTLVQSLKTKLPLHSAVIVFDCYGGGTYLNPADTRHSHSRAILQIVNELATQLGGPLLLRNSLTSEEYMRELLTRMEVAVSLVRKLNPEALVVIVIDAADNSICAAREKKEQSFVHDVIKQPLPDGTRLVVTCRTENKTMLNLPDHQPFELKGFSAPESSEHLKLYFPNATEGQTEEFDRLTQGVPRVQGYALEMSHLGIDAVLTPLRPDGKTLGDLLESWLDEAKRRHGIPEEIDKICEVLVALPRPVPITYVAELAGVMPGTVNSLCVDTRLGLVENNGAISFSDQDFEDHLRLRIEDTARLTASISDLLYMKRNIDSYAAYHVDIFLTRTNRFQDLIALILQDNDLSVISNPIDRQELMLKRIKSAVELGKNEKERSVMIKLLWVAAETVKTDKTVRQLIMENTDLAEEFGDAQAVQRLHLDIEKQAWPIASLFHSAAVLSRFESTKAKADEKLKEAFGWLRWRATLNENERGMYRYPVKPENVAAGLEAMLRLQGADEVRNWLNGLTRQRFVYDCVYHLVVKMLRLDGVSVLARITASMPIRADICLSILKAYRDTNNKAPEKLVERAIKVWHRFFLFGGKPDESIFSAGITLCEAAGGIQSLRIILPDIVAMFSPPMLSYMPYLSGEDVDHVVSILCSRMLKAKLTKQQVTINDFLPDELRDIKEDLPYKELDALKTKRREFDNVFGFLLPAYELRADVILGSISPDFFQSRMDKCLGTIGRSYEVGWRDNAVPVYRLMGQALADAAIMMPGIPNTWMNKMMRTVISNKWVGGSTYFRLMLAGKGAALQTLHAEALRLLDEVRQDLDKAPGTAREQIDLLVQCTRIAEVIDPDVARYYFKLAVEAASDIDDEVFAQIICMASIAEKISNNSFCSNAELAYQFARLVEDSHRRMEGWDHFPWTEAIKGLFFLDPASAFAILSRWDERGVRRIEDEISTVLHIAVQRKYISPELACALSILPVTYENKYEQLATAILDAAQASDVQVCTKECLSIIAEDICLYAPIPERKARASALISWAKNHNLEHSQGAIRLTELLRFLESAYEKPAIDDTPWKTADNVETPDWGKIHDSRSFQTSDEIEAALDEVSKIDRYGRRFQKELLSRIQRCCTVRDYVAQLDALLMVRSEKLSVDILLEALDSRMQEWSYHPNVREWRKEKGADFLERRFSEMIQYNFMPKMRRFQSVFGILEEDLYNLVVSVFPQSIGSSAEIMYEVIQELMNSLSPVEADDVLNWLLERLSRKIPVVCADGLWREELRPPTDSMEIVSKLIWRLLGHPDRRLRWRAAHAVRRAVRQGIYEIVDTLVSFCEDKYCTTMIDYNHEFFWLSARLWMFILLDRLAAENPKVIKHHSELMLKEALMPEVPHALLRHFAQTAALALNEYDPGIYSTSEVDALSCINKSSLPFKKTQRRRSAGNRTKNGEKLRFNFDSTDTLPYWYDPLARVFGESRNTIAQMAEVWICDKWDIPADINYKKDWIRQKYDYVLYSNDHGNGPTIETVQTYAEWHALFCVADELLNAHPVLYSEGYGDPYSYWLKKWALAWPGCWLADIRDPLPLENIYWSLHGQMGEKWEREIPSDIFDPLIGLTKTTVPEFLVMHGYYRRAVRGASESMWISSALVTPDTAPALLRALQTTANPNRYGIPLEDEDLEISLEGFELKGWIKILESGSGGIDEGDPLRNRLSTSLVVPGTDFVEWAELECSSEYKRYWQRGKSDKPITVLECWDEQPKIDREYSGFYSEGHRLWVHVNTLLNYLQERQRCLIVKCMIDRWVDKEGKDKYVPGKAKIYLIHPEGTVETLRESYCIREKNR